MNLISCGEEFADPILAILNDAILHSTALYEYHPRSPGAMTGWFAAKRAGNFPVLGAVTDAGDLAGFATYGTFRAFPAFKYTVEHSVYVAAPYRGRGVGKLLLAELIAVARGQGYHVLVGGIDATNTASLALHERFGFRPAGTLRQVGFKFGRWLDLEFVQLVLDTPAVPTDG